MQPLSTDESIQRSLETKNPELLLAHCGNLPETFAQCQHLQKLTFFESTGLETLHTQKLDFPILSELHLYYSYFQPSILQNLVAQLPALKTLTLHFSLMRPYWEVKAADWAWLLPVFERLEHLYLEGDAHDFIWEVWAASKHNFPNLKTLSFAGNDCTDFSKQTEPYFEPAFFQKFPNLEHFYAGEFFYRMDWKHWLATAYPKLRFLSCHNPNEVAEWVKQQPKNWVPTPACILENALGERDNLIRLRAANWQNQKHQTLVGSFSKRVGCMCGFIKKMESLNLQHIDAWSADPIIMQIPHAWHQLTNVYLYDCLEFLPQINQFLAQMPKLKQVALQQQRLGKKIDAKILLHSENWAFLNPLIDLDLEIGVWTNSNIPKIEFQNLIFAQAPHLERLKIGGEVIKNAFLAPSVSNLKSLERLDIRDIMAEFPEFLNELPKLKSLTLNRAQVQDFPIGLLGFKSNLHLHLSHGFRRIVPEAWDEIHEFLLYTDYFEKSEQKALYKVLQNWEHGKDLSIELIEKATEVKKHQTQKLAHNAYQCLYYRIEHTEPFLSRKKPLQSGQKVRLEGTFQQKNKELAERLAKVGLEAISGSKKSGFDTLILGKKSLLPTDWATQTYGIITESELLDWLVDAEAQYLVIETPENPEIAANLIGLLTSKGVENTVLACELMETGGVPKNPRLLTQLYILLKHTYFFPYQFRLSDECSTLKTRLKKLLVSASSNDFQKFLQDRNHVLRSSRTSFSHFKELFEASFKHPEIDKLWLLAYCIQHCSDGDGSKRGENYSEKHLTDSEKKILNFML